MPGYKGHLVGGVAVFSIGFYFLQPCSTSMLGAGEWLLCACAGSLFPDVDVKSKGQKYAYWLVLALLLFLIGSKNYSLLSVVSICCVTPMLARHRGLFHKTWFVVVAPLTVWFLVSRTYSSLLSSFF